MMAKVTGYLAAVVSGAANEVPRLVSQGKQLCRVQALSVVETAVRAILTATRQMVSVAKVHAVRLSAFLECLDRIGVRLGQRNVHTLIVFVELVKRADDGWLFLTGDVDSQRNAGSPHRSIAVGLSLRLAWGKRGRRCLGWR
jgi:hypothetical protein